MSPMSLAVAALASHLSSRSRSAHAEMRARTSSGTDFRPAAPLLEALDGGSAVPGHPKSVRRHPGPLDPHRRLHPRAWHAGTGPQLRTIAALAHRHHRSRVVSVRHPAPWPEESIPRAEVRPLADHPRPLAGASRPLAQPSRSLVHRTRPLAPMQRVTCSTDRGLWVLISRVVSPLDRFACSVQRACTRHDRGPMPPGSRSIGATTSITAPHGSSLSLGDHGVDRPQGRLDRSSISSHAPGEGRSHSPVDRVIVRDRGRPTPVRGRVVRVRDRLACARGRILRRTDLFPQAHRPVSMRDRIEGLQR